MPAVMRGSGSGGKGRGGSGGGKSKAKREPASYAPLKLGGAKDAGLRPQGAMIATAAVLMLSLVVMLTTGGRAHALGVVLNRLVDREMTGAGFRLAAIHVQGASRYAEADIRRAVAAKAGDPILRLDLKQLRDQVETVGWVKSARVVRLLPDTLVIAIAERSRLAVWQHDRQTHVIDAAGVMIPEADPGLFADLPLVVGEGANEAAPAILPLVTTRPRLMQRLEALVRVDGRRWDLRLKDGSLIQLPATGEDSALIQLDQLDQGSRLLELGFARIDLREPQAVLVRPSQKPAVQAGT